MSLRIATMNATLSIVLGTLAAITLVRFGRFRGRTLFSTMVSAPLVMPDVILGLASLLLLPLVLRPWHRREFTRHPAELLGGLDGVAGAKEELGPEPPGHRGILRGEPEPFCR